MTEFKTMEHLKSRVSATYGAVLRYGDKVFVTDLCWRDGFYAEIYEMVETPEADGIDQIECRLSLLERAETCFPDGGSAIAWALSRK